MNIKKKLMSLLLCALTVFSMSLCAFAEEKGATQDGVNVVVDVDEESYISGDTVKYTITITNTNDYDIEDLSISYDQPYANFEAPAEGLPKSVDYIKAGETKVLEFEAVLTSETEAPFTFPVVPVAIGVVAVLVIVIVVVIVLKNKKKATAVMSIVALLAGTLASVATPSVEAKADETEETLVKNNDYKRVSVHDPSIVKDPESGYYYIFGSHKSFAKSKDLISWENFSTNIQTDWYEIFGPDYEAYCTSKTGTAAKDQLNGCFWAPDVIYNETMGKWCMYYSLAADAWNATIVLLTADNIEGPYNYEGVVLYGGICESGDKTTAINQERYEMSDFKKVLGDETDLTRYTRTSESLVSIIDPNLQYDENGNLWMVFGSWSAGVYMIEMDETTGFRDYNVKYETKTNVSDAYYGIKIAGGCYNSGEGPYLLQTEDYYYLFMSIGNLEASGGYNMRIYRSENINGPYVDENGKSAIFTSWQADIGYKKGDAVTNKYNTLIGIKLMGAYKMYGVGRTQVAQGHNSAFVDDDGKMYVIYHTRFANGGEGHEVRVHQLFQTETGWLAAAPYEYSGETLSEEGYTAKEVAGTYDFVIQRPDLVYAGEAVPNEGELFMLRTGKTVRVNSEDVVLSMTFTWKEAGVKITDSQGIVYAQDLTLNEDGTISGDYSGTWEFTEGSNVKMTIDGVEYSGVFIKQQNELTSRDMTLCFTLVGGNKCAWGAYNPESNK